MTPTPDPTAWDGDMAATVPAWWFEPGSGHFDDVNLHLRPAPEPPAPAPARRRKHKPASNQASFLTTDEAPTDGKYDDKAARTRR